MFQTGSFHCTLRPCVERAWSGRENSRIHQIYGFLQIFFPRTSLLATSFNHPLHLNCCCRLWKPFADWAEHMYCLCMADCTEMFPRWKSFPYRSISSNVFTWMYINIFFLSYFHIDLWCINTHTYVNRKKDNKLYVLGVQFLGLLVCKWSSEVWEIVHYDKVQSAINHCLFIIRKRLVMQIEHFPVPNTQAYAHSIHPEWSHHKWTALWTALRCTEFRLSTCWC